MAANTGQQWPTFVALGVNKMSNWALFFRKVPPYSQKRHGVIFRIDLVFFFRKASPGHTFGQISFFFIEKCPPGPQKSQGFFSDRFSNFLESAKITTTGGWRWPILAGLGRPWPALAGLGRPWPALAGHGRPWLGDFLNIWEDFRCEKTRREAGNKLPTLST